MSLRGTGAEVIKRLLDILAAIVGLVATTAFYPVIAVAIKLDSPGPVFYQQRRVGLNKCPFFILKFRTMSDHAENERPITIGNDHRVTRVGKKLRRYEIDEWPTLINVLKGDMSVVGPRPEIPRYADMYTREQQEVFSLRPGMTDLGTLRFRDETKLLVDHDNFENIYLGQIMPEKIRLNMEYVQSRSLLLDLRIVLQTLLLIIRGAKGPH